MHRLRYLDPRNSLTTAAVWFVVTMAFVFSTLAAAWIGSLARESVLSQHVRQVVLEADELASDLDQALVARLGAMREASRILRSDARPRSAPTLGAVFDRLHSMYPELDWIALADAKGKLVASRQADGELRDVADMAWFKAGLKGPWLGNVGAPAPAGGHGVGEARRFADMAAPLRDADGEVVGVVSAHLGWRWASNYAHRLDRSLEPTHADDVLVLDRHGTILVGPRRLQGRPWVGSRAVDRGLSRAVLRANADGAPGTAASVQATPDGSVLLVVRAAVDASTEQRSLQWQVQIAEPRSEADARANSLRLRIVLVALGLGAAAAVVGGLGAHWLTRRLDRLSRSVAAVAIDDAIALPEPYGRDEVSRLSAAFFRVLGDLRRERSELRSLTAELEERVLRRTEQVEQLSAQTRDAAFVRERLKLARDLHDTLAHSMMAMLAEIRILRKLQVHDPAALVDELARAEAVAQAGLNEARAAIRQLRSSAVRDVGLEQALCQAGRRLADRSGCAVDVVADTDPAGMDIDRAETLYRIAEEVLRNVERHARASHVRVEITRAPNCGADLVIHDDGIGFDTSVVPPGHYGLVGIRELATLLGAELTIVSAPGAGTTVEVHLAAGSVPNVPVTPQRPA